MILAIVPDPDYPLELESETLLPKTLQTGVVEQIRRNQAGDEFKASSLLSSIHSARRCYACYQKRKVITDLPSCQSKELQQLAWHYRPIHSKVA